MVVDPRAEAWGWGISPTKDLGKVDAPLAVHISEPGEGAGFVHPSANIQENMAPRVLG